MSYSPLLRASLAAGLALPACTVTDPLYCDESTACTNPDRPFCDLRGEFPASDGVARTCIPSPDDPDADDSDDPADGGGEDDGDGEDDGGDDPDDPDDGGGTDRTVLDLSLGQGRTCAVLSDGALRCWGTNADGLLGYPLDVEAVGDDELPFEAGDVPTGGAVKQVVLALNDTCILYRAGNVRCFGSNLEGILGYGHTDPVAGPPSKVPDVPLGEPAQMIAGGLYHFCAVLESGAVRCWGTSGFSALGYGDGTRTVGDDEVPSDMPAIDVGGAASFVATGVLHTCAILAGSDGRVRCWGMGLQGVLGYGNTLTIGDDEPPSSAGDVNIGGAVVALAAYDEGNCVVFDTGAARCWGDGNFGDQEPPRLAPPLDLGGVPTEVAGGPRCALSSDQSVHCWGRNDSGQLGLGHTKTVGQSGIVEAGAAMLGGPAAKLGRGFLSPKDAHMCALMEDGAVRCWGHNAAGQLGLGHRENIGDNEPPADAPAVRVLD